MKFRRVVCSAIFCLGFLASSVYSGNNEKQLYVEQPLRLALSYMQSQRYNGAWAMCWTSDRNTTWGEHAVRPNEVVTVQPPATPSIAGVYLRAWQVLDDPDYRAVAVEAGDALLRGQLECGGFPHDFSIGEKGVSHYESSGTFDDDVSQGAIRYLIDLWKATKEQKFLKGVQRCAQFMLDAQYENGGWPQAFPLRKGYSHYITLNDDAMMDVIRAMFLCYHEFGDERYYKAAVRGADCLLALQGEPPQAGWAQQFTPEGEPAPARRFEPTALTSAESVRALELLVEVYKETGDKKYLAAGPPAFEWLEQSRLPNGKHARFYRYGDNKPLYCTERGEIVYDVSLARPGYSWQGNYFGSKLPKLYERLSNAPVEDRLDILKPKSPPSLSTLENRVKPILASLDERGRWLSPLSGSRAVQYREKYDNVKGVFTVDASLFVRNAELLLEYLQQIKN